MQFKPTLARSILLLSLALIFGRLGWWQLERQQEKLLLFEQFEDAPMMDAGQALTNDVRFARINAYGRYDPERHILLDNKIWQSRAGVEVLTPFELHDGRVLLVNRGWLPLAPDRRSLPEVPTPDISVSITGRLNHAVAAGPRIGAADELRAERWPQLVTYLDPERIGAALELDLEPWLIQLDQSDPTGFAGRVWRPAVMGPEVHGAYALQWFALATAAVIVWISLGFTHHAAG